MTKNSPSLFSRSRERRRLLQPARALYEGVNYSALVGDEDSDVEETELGSINRASRPRENLVERVLQPGDTLQSIALQYHVPVAELKRVNNIHRENEIHARTCLMIPVGPISSLIDLTPVAVHGDTKKDSNEPRILSIGSGCNPQEFLAAMDRDLARIRASVPVSETSAVPEILFNGIDSDKVDSSCSGSDWGLRWQQILFCSLLLTFILPIFVWYKRQQDENHDNLLNHNNPAV